jgi:hypothetical protein
MYQRISAARHPKAFSILAVTVLVQVFVNGASEHLTFKLSHRR